MNDTKICTVCETGRKDYLLDKSSVFCSYISCLKNGNCGMFKKYIKNSSTYCENKNIVIK